MDEKKTEAVDEKDGTMPGGVPRLASALAVHSFLHISSCVLLHSSCFLPHNCALCTYTSSVLSLARSWVSQKQL